MNRGKRIRQLFAEMSAITEFVDGSITSSRNYYMLKDGTRRQSAPHFKFTTKGARGRQKCVTVPGGRIERIRQLAENGKRYRRLEAEYSRLVTEECLAEGK